MPEPVDFRLGRVPDLRMPENGNFALNFTFTGITLTGYEATLTARRGSNAGRSPLLWSKSGLTVGATTINFNYAQTQADDNSKALSLVTASGKTDYALTVRQSGGGAIVFRLQGSVDWVDEVGDFDAGSTDTTSFTFSASGASVSVALNGSDAVSAYLVEQTLTDGATVAYNVASGVNAKWTIGGDRTLALPTNVAAGQSGRLVITQDGTGGRALTLTAGWGLCTDNLADVAAMAAGAKCVLSWTALTTTTFASTLIFVP